MVADQPRFRRCCFVVHEDVLGEFKEVAFQDNLSVAKAIEQFLANYIYCLDPSFIGGHIKGSRKAKKKAFNVRISADVYSACEEKTRTEKVDMNAIVEQFMMHYNAFIKTHTPSIYGTMD